MAKKKTIDEFKEDLKKVWGDRYAVSPNSIYVNNKTPINFICPVHGEFRQLPVSILNGHGCQKCTKKHRYTTEEFIEECRKVHGDEYDYSKVKYVNTSTPVIIICREHGEFEQTPNGHLISGHGCPICSKEKIGVGKRIGLSEFVERANKVHSNKYCYDKTKYVNIDAKVEIICPEHGSFLQAPYNHLKGQMCPECSKIVKSIKLSGSLSDFIRKSKSVHGDKYDYSKVDYKSAHKKVTIICPKHGSFLQTPDNHLRGHGCPVCGHIISNCESEIFEFVKSLVGEDKVRHNVKYVINPLELDIFVPDKNIAIEYNGLRWHSEEFQKDKNYHLNKLNECNEKGIRLIQIFEDEYVNHKEIVLGKIKHLMKMDKLPKIMARKCSVNEIDNEDAERFLNENHIQGFARSTVYLGAFNGNELVGVMSFLKEKEGYWNLTRFASSNKYQCNGVAGKLFSHFVKTKQPVEVKSFADRRWTTNPDNNLYTKLNFKLTNILKPDYRYVQRDERGINRLHKFNFRKNILNRKYGLPLTMTESEMCEKIGAYKIYDCGLFKYVWKNDSLTVNMN